MSGNSVHRGDRCPSRYISSLGAADLKTVSAFVFSMAIKSGFSLSFLSRRHKKARARVGKWCEPSSAGVMNVRANLHFSLSTLIHSTLKGLKSYQYQMIK